MNSPHFRKLPTAGLQHVAPTLLLLMIPLMSGTGEAQSHARPSDEVNAALRKVLAEQAPAEKQLAARDALAKRQAAAAISLMRMGQPAAVWPLLRHSPDPTLRSYLIRDIGASNVPADLIARRLSDEAGVSARRALILSLGGFSEDAIPAVNRTALVTHLLRLYREDPDPGIHSAIDWLLRHGKHGLLDRRIDWKQRDALDAIDRELAGRLPGDRNWFVTSEGHTLAVLREPAEFMMGAPPYEPGRPKGPDEAQHRVRIPRSFAVATKEVTVAQFHRFLEENPSVKALAKAAGSRSPLRTGPMVMRSSPEGDRPQVNVTWFDAAQYCNWLSRRERIPEEEWCYPAADQIKEGMEIRKDCLRRAGYRMLTEAEWEFAARAGATTSRYFGSSEELLREYAWYTGTTFDERSWPVGQLKPNDFGLFDMLGSVWEWGHDLWKQYPTGESVRDDVEDATLIVSAKHPRPRRGGSFTYSAAFIRAAQRGAYIPDERRDSVGFRIARTWTEPRP